MQDWGTHPVKSTRNRKDDASSSPMHRNERENLQFGANTIDSQNPTNVGCYTPVYASVIAEIVSMLPLSDLSTVFQHDH